jgi:hypothetical protein
MQDAGSAVPRKLLNLTRDVALAHNHRLDPTFNGRYIRRLPDRTLVYADEYDERLR